MTDIFRETRERVPALNAARFYGITIDRKGWALCPFHQDRSPSMSFKDGRFKCWACGVSGDSIDFVGRLFGLDGIGAVRRLNTDFGLSLPIDRKPTEAEKQASRRQRELTDTYREFEAWRVNFINTLNVAIRAAYKPFKDWDSLSPGQALALRWQPALEYWADTLSVGIMAQQMGIFRDRKGVHALCRQILNSTQMKSGAA